MKFDQGIFAISLTVSYLFGTVQCIDIRQFFSWWFSSSKRSTNSMLTSSDCKTVNNRRVCKFNNAKNLKLDVDDLIELMVDDKNGRSGTVIATVMQMI
jgi:hypothetical protein